jgi:hypothetical protein
MERVLAFQEQGVMAAVQVREGWALIYGLAD